MPTASPLKTLDDLLSAFRASPESVSWGGGSAGGTDDLLVRLEGLYFDLGSKKGNVAGGGENDSFRVDQDIFVARIGINYRLN